MSDDRPEDRDPLRVVLVGCTGLVGDLIERAVRQRPEIAVVARLASSCGIAGIDAEASAGVDVVVWHDAAEAEVSAWLEARRTAPVVLATIDDGRGASLWELVPQRHGLGALSVSILTDTICSARRSPASAAPLEPTTKETRWRSN
jgi:hypothetical protein